MSFIAAVCPACHKHIQVPSDVVNPACPYCGAIVEQESAAPAATIATLMGMAQTAALAGNNAEALSYFNRVLESDPNNSAAWIGKGKAAGWQTTLANLRVGEMLVAFNHAIANAEPDARAVTLQSVVLDANHLIVTIYKLARDHMLEYVSLDSSWANYLNQMGQMIDALSTVHSWDPTDRLTLENIVHICKDNIEGVSYRDRFDQNAAKAWTLSPQYEATLKAKMDEAANQLRALDPSYAPPAIEKKKAEACFVITASMGDPQHPHVTFLQAFRDDWLRRRGWGQKAIAIYYRVGPSAAAFIARTDRRRSISRVVVVRPMVWLATWLLAK